MGYSKKSIQAMCPVCQCIDGQLLWSATAKESAAHFVSPAQDTSRYQQLASHIAVLWGKKECHVVQCSSCNFTYSYPYVAGDKVFYDLAHEGSSYPKWRWEFDFAFNLISSGEKINPRILEIGAGDGAFASRLLGSVTIPQNFVAIEYSNHGKEKIESLGVRCFAKDIRALTNSDLGGSFDYICLFQVLEHLDHINDLLKSLGSHLNNDGEIIIAVPNDKRIEFNELNGALLDMPPNHIGRWTHSAFNHFATSNDFVVVQHQYEPGDFVSEAVQFIKYRILRRSQKPHSLSHKLLYEKRRIVRGVGLRLIFLVDFILNLPRLIALAFKIKNRGGGCQLVRLKKHIL